MKNSRILLTLTICVLLESLSSLGFSQVGVIDPSFNVTLNGPINALAVSRDNKILLGGSFTTVGGKSHVRLARLNADGSLDAAFTASADSFVNSIVVQDDDSILIGGYFTKVNGVTRRYMARLLPNGALDTAYDPQPSGALFVMVPQPDGRVIMSGEFAALAGKIVDGFARVLPSGLRDTTFSTVEVGNQAYSIALAPDGKILDVARYKARLVRRNTDGTADPTYPTSVGGENCLAVLPDGKVVTYYETSTYNGVMRRYTVAGALDTSFAPAAMTAENGGVYVVSLLPQEDGKLIVAGQMEKSGSSPRVNITRLNADGSTDPDFSPNLPGGTVCAGLIDGRFLAVTSINFGAAFFLNRVSNGVNPSTITVPNPSSVRLFRSGANQLPQEVWFEYSSNGGATWTYAGRAHRVGGGWGLDGLTLPSAGKVRANVRLPAGGYNGSSSLLSLTNDYSLPSNGTFTVEPAGLVSPGATLSVTFKDWSDPGVALPLRYQVFLDGVPVLSPSTSTSWSLLAPVQDGNHTLVGRIYNGNDAFTEVSRTLSVDSTPRSANVTTLPATAVSRTGATVPARIGSNNAMTTVYFERSDLPGEAHWLTGSPPAVLSPDPAFSALVLEGLAPHASYSVRAIGRNSAGTAFGNLIEFTTLNADPIAVDDVVHAVGGRAISFDPRLNDGDADGDVLKIIDVKGGVHGTATFVGDSITYVGDETFDGNDSLSYSIADGFGGTATGTIRLSNVPPTTDPFILLHPSIGPGGTFTLDLASHLADADGDGLSIIAVSSSAHAPIRFSGTTLTYGPADASFRGTDNFSYTVSDGHGGTANGKVGLVNSPPSPLGDALLLAPGVTTLDVLANDSDPDGDELTITSVYDSAHGTVSTDGKTVTYIPAADFEGVDSFLYTVTDGRGAIAYALNSIKAGYPVARELAEQGAQIPGMPEGATWAQFGSPSLMNAGSEAGWRATYRLDGKTREGIFSGTLAQPTLRLESGSSPTNALGQPLAGVTFRHFEEPVFSEDAFALIASVGGRGITPANDRGIWVAAGGEMRQIARTDAIAPGTPGPGTPGARFRSFDSVAMPAPGMVVFRGKLRQKSDRISTEGVWVYEQGFLFFRAKPRPVSDRVGDANDEGLWLWSSGTGTRLILREGQLFHWSAGPRQLLSFRVLAPVNGSGGHARYDSFAQQLDVLLHFTDGSSAIVAIGPDGALEPLRSTGEADSAGHIAHSLGLPSRPGNGDLPVVRGAFREKGSAAPTRQAIFDLQSQSPLVEQNSAAPGLPGATFGSFGDPVAGLGVNWVKTIFFSATLHGAGAGTGASLWSFTTRADPQAPSFPVSLGAPAGATQHSSLQLIARVGEEAPGMPGRTFAAFDSLSVLEGRGPIFVARVTPPAGQPSARAQRGCWAQCSDGSLQLIFADGSGVDGRTLRSLSMLDLVPGSYGQRRAWAAGDQTPSIIYRATWSDGTQTVVTVAIP